MIRLILRSARRGSAVIVVEFVDRRRTMVLMRRVSEVILESMRTVVPVQSGALRASLQTDFTSNRVELSGLVYMASVHFRSRRNAGWITRGLAVAEQTMNLELMFRDAGRRVGAVPADLPPIPGLSQAA